MLDIRCWPEGRVAWQLIDARALEGYREVLREGLRPYVQQVEIKDPSAWPYK